MSNVIEFGSKTEKTIPTPVYHDYELHLHKLENEDEPTVLKDYGFLINNGAFYGIGRYFGEGEDKRMEFLVIAGVEDVRFARAVGEHVTRPAKLDA